MSVDPPELQLNWLGQRTDRQALRSSGHWVSSNRGRRLYPDLGALLIARADGRGTRTQRSAEG